MGEALYNIGDVVQYLSDGKNWDRWPPMTVTGVGDLDVNMFWYTVNPLPFWVPENQLRKYTGDEYFEQM